MFRRRIPLPFLDRVRDALWPRAGWRRASYYIAHRVRRLPGTPYRIAAGFACGAAISFTPFIGFHFVGAALLAFFMRGNLMASAIGTAVGNPWTFPFIWVWIFGFGNWLLGGEVRAVLPQGLSMTYIINHPLEILWPMTVGGVPTAIAAWFVFFWPVRGAVSRYQLIRRRRMHRRARIRRQQATARGAETGTAEGRTKEAT